MSMLRSARSALAWPALTIVVAACDREPAAKVADSSTWGTGIVQHARPAAALVEGPRVSTPQALAAGQWDSPKQMYDATCGGCHGAGVGPHILGQALPEAYIRYVGRNGLRSMPPFRVTDYTDAELATLATWINAQPAAKPAAASAAAPAPAKPAAKPAPAPSGPAQPPTPVAGGAAGQAVYAKCSGCHESGAPALRGHGLPEGYVHVVVRNGLRRMPAFPESSISDNDLTVLVDWLNAQPRGAR
jgi:mono/diheme cytochrome c family protein